MIRITTLFILLFHVVFAQADTIDHYINILDGIPKMEVKADPQAQMWARSARNVLSVTTETIAETLLQANEVAEKQGKPLFCLPSNVQLTAETVNDLLVKTYRNISSQRSDKEKMTVSQIALIGVTQSYPCQKFQQPSLPFNTTTSQAIQHVGANNN